MENLFTHQNIEKVLKPTQELLDNTSNQANYIHNILAQLSGVESNTDKDMFIKMLYDAIHIFTERYNNNLENKLVSLLKEVKKTVELLDQKGYLVIITPPFKDYENIYKMELNISKPIHI